MATTPYAPPGARVGDPVEKITEKPQAIRLAVLLLWISVGLAVAVTAWRMPAYLQMIRSGVMAPVYLFVQLTWVAVSCGLVILVAFMVAAGRDWARWIYVLLYVLGTFITAGPLAFIPNLIQYLQTAPISAASMLLQPVLQTVALVAMFVRPSREWFAAKRKR